ncbi:MAG TPA: ATP-binding protein, partial [Polyangiaceae bacterium]|nr:ATP-binding protein [Polyangiaceae bacterium]
RRLPACQRHSWAATTQVDHDPAVAGRRNRRVGGSRSRRRVDHSKAAADDNHAADLIFQIVTRRYEKRPTALTTNLAFSEWTTVFPNAACATALIDRLTHHAEIITMEGESYRKREAEETKKRRTKGRRGHGARKR